MRHPSSAFYSGGLDSAAGLARRLSDGIDAPLIPVVVRHRTDIAKKATEQIDRLGRAFHTKLQPICAAMSMAAPKRTSTRSTGVDGWLLLRKQKRTVVSGRI